MAVIKDLSMKAYGEIAALRSSDLKTFAISPAHYKHSKSKPQEDNTNLAMGSAVHTLILEPDKFEGEFAVYRAHKTRCQAYYAVASSNPSKIFLLQSEYETVMRIAESVRNKKHVMDIINPCDKELSITGKVGDVFCKARFDGFDSSINRAIDLKTTGKSATQFRRAIWDFGYHLSNAFYEMVAETNAMFVKDFVYIVIEKEPPYEVLLTTIDREWIDLARKEVERCLTQFSECLKTNVWPGYSTEIQEIKLKKE